MEPASDTGRTRMDDESAVLDGAPGGSEGGGESDGAGPPASLGCAFLLGLQLLHALLHFPILMLLLVLESLLLHVAVAQVHLRHVRHDKANGEHGLADQRRPAAQGSCQEAIEQHEDCQRELVPEAQAVAAVHQGEHHGQQPEIMKLTFAKRVEHEAAFGS
eukprot:scaffold71970_cov63-Phaeocystis_antarctica.AAC.2